jgi:hypothetical protein
MRQGDKAQVTTNEQRAQRWASTAGTDRYRDYARNSNVFGDSRQLYSYGYHFPLARIMLDDAGRRSWFLVNGDSYSVSTTRHQGITRAAIEATGLDSMIVPFSALDRAGIVRDSITPVEILPDTWLEETRTSATLHGVPEIHKPLQGFRPFAGYHDAQQRADGSWMWTEQRHQLGAAVFSADYVATERVRTDDGWRSVGRTWETRKERGRAYFVSGFDENEPQPLYFLAQLPEGAEPASYRAAIDALKPRTVTAAIAEGREVLRQGDVFAIPTDMTTRRLSAMGGDRERGAYVLGVNHTATESVTLREPGMPYGRTWARGIMRHKPRESWRRPEHRMVKLGDRVSWYELVRNTVPAGRSWSVSGQVD